MEPGASLVDCKGETEGFLDLVKQQNLEVLSTRPTIKRTLIIYAQRKATPEAAHLLSGIHRHAVELKLELLYR